MAEIDDYVAGLDPEDAPIVGGAYASARRLVPDAEQGVSYGMPALIFQSRPLLSVMRAKGHFGLYPYSAVVVAKVVETLGPVDGLTSAKGTLRLPLGAPIPDIVVSQLVLARRDEILETNTKKPKPRARVIKQAD
jgi:uncharacterized protein YdhG (YjbR/CyaY superfamily)